MNLLFRLLKPKSLVTAGAAGLILMALWLGPQFGIPRRYLFFGIIAVFLIWMIVMLIMRVRASRASKALEKSIEEQAQAQIDGSRPGREKDIEELKEGLQQAIEALKRSRVGKSRGSGGALYFLPWYMIIGPPAVGKTTLLKKSGLNFPYADPKRNDPSVKGVGGTRNCDWWFAEEAVILDTAGRYVLPVEEDDSQEWLGFLDLLRRHRGRKPINGLLVAVSIEDLVKGGIEAVEEHAKKIRTRIDELINRLGISFPVYLVFTKCDLIRGFVEYYGDINKDQRASVWGATISRDRSATETAEDIFRAEMALLEQQLLNARIPRQAAGYPQ
ncbi:MAG: hypothetical protein KJ927_08655 [Candidatus Eisenbacteria bacterium]|nr:hypothetical protein [Candidatus Eisenbacteria bacterium]